MTFEELIALHQSHLQSLHRHASTRYNQRAVTGDFARFCQTEFGLADPRELRRDHVAAYQRELGTRDLTPLVRYSRFNLVRAWLAWAAYRGHLLSDPGRDFHVRHPPHLPLLAVLEILKFNHQRGFSVEPDAPLFPNREHRAMSTRAVRRMLEKHCQRADLDQAVSPHDLRHTFGSRLVERDVPTRTVQVLMGHVRLSSTQRYLHANAEQLAAAVGRL